MRPMRPNHRFTIHPSIDSLVEQIGKLDKTADPVVVEALRESCVQKLRSYKCEEYLKRYTSETDKSQARARWEVVSEFANRPRKRDVSA